MWIILVNIGGNIDIEDDEIYDGDEFNIGELEFGFIKDGNCNDVEIEGDDENDKDLELNFDWRFFS